MFVLQRLYIYIYILCLIQFLGHVEVDHPKGSDMVREAIRKMKVFVMFMVWISVMLYFMQERCLLEYKDMFGYLYY